MCRGGSVVVRRRRRFRPGVLGNRRRRPGPGQRRHSRSTADQLRVKVVGEGANLGMTQRARVEFAMRGGRVNTDAIDNSAGVNCSDIEVNIKIALSGAVRKGALSAGRAQCACCAK